MWIYFWCTTRGGADEFLSDRGRTGFDTLSVKHSVWLFCHPKGPETRQFSGKCKTFPWREPGMGDDGALRQPTAITAAAGGA